MRACKVESEGEEGVEWRKGMKEEKRQGQRKEEKEKQGEVKLWRTSKIEVSRTVAFLFLIGWL